MQKITIPRDIYQITIILVLKIFRLYMPTIDLCPLQLYASMVLGIIGTNKHHTQC